MENPVKMDDFGVPLFSETSSSKSKVRNWKVDESGAL